MKKSILLALFLASGFCFSDTAVGPSAAVIPGNSNGTAVGYSIFTQICFPNGSCINGSGGGGSPTCTRVPVSGSATLGVNTCIEAVTSTASAVTITLPAASGTTAGQLYYLKDESCAAATHNITLARAGSDTIDDAQTSILITANCGSITFYSNGVSHWFTL